MVILIPSSLVDRRRMANLSPPTAQHVADMARRRALGRPAASTPLRQVWYRGVSLPMHTRMPGGRKPCALRGVPGSSRAHPRCGLSFDFDNKSICSGPAGTSQHAPRPRSCVRISACGLTHIPVSRSGTGVNWQYFLQSTRVQAGFPDVVVELITNRAARKPPPRIGF